jgi:hypothetical protein
MRRVGYALLLVVFAVSAFGVTREEGRPRDRDKGNAVVQMVKRIVRALGDGLTIPTRRP